MNATALKLRGAALAALAGVALFGMGCDPPALPPPGPDRVYANLSQGEIKGLHRTLRAIKNDVNDPTDPSDDSIVSKDLDINGHLVRAILSLHGPSNPCPATNDAYLQTWSCYTTVTGVFRLKNKFHDEGAGVNGGNVQFDQDAAGDKIKFTEQVIYFWDAGNHLLTVAVRYPASAAVNFQRNWGLYSVKGKTNTTITTSSSSESVDLSYSYPFTLGLSGSVDKTQFQRTSFVRVRVAGQPYWADQGLFEYKREAFGESDFVFGMDWLTNALVDLNTQVTQFTAECGSSFKHSGSVSAKLENSSITGGTNGTKFSAAIKYAQMSKAECKAWADTLAAHLHYQAANAFACGAGAACPGETVGERFRSYIRVIDLFNGNCRRLYNVGFTAAVNWNLSLVASNGQKMA